MNRNLQSSHPTPLPNFEHLSEQPLVAPQHWKFLIAAVVVALLVGGGALALWLLSPEGKLRLVDLGVALVLIAALAYGGRLLVAGEAARRSRLIACELIGTTIGGAALGALVITYSDKPLGLGRVAQLLVIQLFGAVCAGVAAFGIAFFVAMATKFVVHMTGRSRPEVEAVFIGVITGAVGGAIFGGVAHYSAWFPFFAAAVCGLAAYRAVVLYDRLEAAERAAKAAKS